MAMYRHRLLQKLTRINANAASNYGMFERYKKKKDLTYVNTTCTTRIPIRLSRIK